VGVEGKAGRRTDCRVPRLFDRFRLFSLLALLDIHLRLPLCLLFLLHILLLLPINLNNLNLLLLLLVLLPANRLSNVEVTPQIHARLLPQRVDRREEEEDSTREDDRGGLGAGEAAEEIVEQTKENRTATALEFHALVRERSSEYARAKSKYRNLSRKNLWTHLCQPFDPRLDVSEKPFARGDGTELHEGGEDVEGKDFLDVVGFLEGEDEVESGFEGDGGGGLEGDLCILPRRL
jgi:hypothetical protein